MPVAPPLDPAPASRRTTSRWATAIVLVAGLALGGGHGAAFADDDSVPTEADVAAATKDAADKGRDVAGVQADLIRANLALDGAGDAAAQAAEAWNGARWRAAEARREARDAQASADAASADVAAQRELYAATVVRSYEEAAQIQGLAAVVESDGIAALIDRSITVGNTSLVLDQQYDSFTAASAVADVAATNAEQAAGRASAAELEAEQARDAAAQAQAAAGSRAEEIAADKADLIAELAALQGISVRLAEKRQSALEREAAEAAAAAAQAAADAQAQAEAAAEAQALAEQQASSRRSSRRPRRPPASRPRPRRRPRRPPRRRRRRPPPRRRRRRRPRPPPRPPPRRRPRPPPRPTPTPTATPTATPTPTPSPSGGASAAVAFAASQIGKPYKYGASGPDAWDCSGLTAAAWARGGKSIPHYSVAQYTQSTRISASQLAPGDLVFWGSSSSPTSIYHVAIYIGDGQIIHAPRTGRDVGQESMYYWRTPNFFARP